MAAKAQESRRYSVPMEYFVEKLRNINSAGLRVKLMSENPDWPDRVWYRIHHGTTFLSWGEKITVTLMRSGEGTMVDVLSQCGLPTQFIDWGKNASNVRAIFSYLERFMPRP